MQFHIRPWNRTSDHAFFDYCQLESFKTTLPNADSLTEEEILHKYQEFDANDPIDMSDPHHMVFIGETLERQPAGLIWFYHREPFWRFTQPLTWIYNLHVKPEYRRKGLAKLLLKATEEWTAQQNLALIALHVLEQNHAARALYEASGYTLAATHKESYFYEKDLD